MERIKNNKLESGKNMSSPGIARMLLNKILLFKDNPFVIGDLEEFYHETLKEKGRFSADVWYWMQVIKSFIPFVQQKIVWGGNNVQA